MIKKDLSLPLVLLVLSLAGAFWVSLPQTEMEAGQSQWYQLRPESISRMTLVTKDSTTTFSRGESRFWVSIKDASGLNEFSAQKKIEESLSKLANLIVARDLGAASSLKLDDYGLSGDDLSTLTVMSGEQESIKLTIGKKAYGSKNVYVKNEIKQTVGLVSTEIFEDLEKSKLRLFQKTILDVEMDAFHQLDLIKAGSTTTFTSNAKSEWLSANGKAWPQIKNLLTQLLKTNAEAYTTEPIDQVLLQKSPLFSLQFIKDLKIVDELIAVRDQDGKYFVKTRTTQRFVGVDGARFETLEKDIQSLAQP